MLAVQDPHVAVDPDAGVVLDDREGDGPGMPQRRLGGDPAERKSSQVVKILIHYLLPSLHLITQDIWFWLWRRRKF